MRLRSIVTLLLLAGLLAPAALGARQFKQGELPKVDFKTEVAPKVSISYATGQSLPARLKFESSTRGLDVRAQVLKVTYTKIGLQVEMSGGSYTRYTGMFATENAFQELLLEFGSNGDLVTEKVTR